MGNKPLLHVDHRVGARPARVASRPPASHGWRWLRWRLTAVHLRNRETEIAQCITRGSPVAGTLLHLPVHVVAGPRAATFGHQWGPWGLGCCTSSGSQWGPWGLGCCTSSGSQWKPRGLGCCRCPLWWTSSCACCTTVACPRRTWTACTARALPWDRCACLPAAPAACCRVAPVLTTPSGALLLCWHASGRMARCPALALVQVMAEAQPRSTLFTGSQRVAEKLAVDTRGKVGTALPYASRPCTPDPPRSRALQSGDGALGCRLPAAGTPHTSVPAAAHRSSLLQVFLEDAGFDWKLLGPDVSHVDYVAWQCDQDAYACRQGLRKPDLPLPHHLPGRNAVLQAPPHPRCGVIPAGSGAGLAWCGPAPNAQLLRCTHSAMWLSRKWPGCLLQWPEVQRAVHSVHAQQLEGSRPGGEDAGKARRQQLCLCALDKEGNGRPAAPVCQRAPGRQPAGAFDRV
jgi:hypothetical protein